jgi:multidrug efflux pump subunit AcrA (membrane-fusion protein)
MVLLKLTSSGSMVRKGDLVAEIDPQAMRDSVDDELDTLKDLDNSLKKKKVANELSTETLRQTLRNAKANLDKAKLDMQAADVRTELDRESLKLSLEEAEATYKELQSNAPLTMESQRADLRISEISRHTQEIHLKQHQDNVDRLIFHAPMDGMVVVQTMNRPGGDQVTLAIGDTMRPGQQILKVINPAKMQVEGQVSQSEVAGLRIGQEAVVRLDAFPGSRYQARVYAIGALAVSSGRSQYYIRTVPVQVEILNPDKRLIPDLSAAADVLLNVEKNALVVPLSSVERRGNEAFVEVKTPKGFVKRAVKLGTSNGTQVALLDGVQEGDVIRAN